MADDSMTVSPETGWFGHRKIGLVPDGTRLILSDGVRVEWKSPGIAAAAPGGVIARPALVDGLDCVEIETPKGTGWIRLVIDLSAVPQDTLTGVRVLIRLTRRDGSPRPSAGMAVAAGRFTGSRLNLIDAGAARIAYTPEQWHDITGAFLQPAGPEAYGIVLNLPEDHMVALSLAEIGRQAVAAETYDRRALDAQGAAFVAPFRARLLDPDEARRAAACPAVRSKTPIALPGIGSAKRRSAF